MNHFNRKVQLQQQQQQQNVSATIIIIVLFIIMLFNFDSTSAFYLQHNNINHIVRSTSSSSLSISSSSRAQRIITTSSYTGRIIFRQQKQQQKLQRIQVVSSSLHCYCQHFELTLTSLSLSLSIMDDDTSYFVFDNILPIILVGIAITIGIAANTIISQMLQGEQGLGSYLSDGTGYSKSKFKPLSNTNLDTNNSNNNRAVQSNVLPWLTNFLPQFDYVEVAGQEKKVSRNINMKSQIQQQEQQVEASNNVIINETLQIELERLRLELYYQIQNGNTDKAMIVKTQLETLMKNNNIEYDTNNNNNKE